MSKPHSNRTRRGLPEARVAAALTLAAARPRQAVALVVRSCHAQDPNTRQQSADTLRRLATKSEGRALLRTQAAALLDALSQALSAAPPNQEDWRTRSHLLLAAAHAAHTSGQRQRAAQLAVTQINVPGNVLRCCALESLGLLARHEPSLRNLVEPLFLERLATGTPAERVRVREALRLLGSSMT